ncbi:MAG: alpha/beta hydrolase [Candidatus Dadabacteria bacterium]|nr:alpha/beta hydrolase [Candidatus Dadabacteria bacterium]
MPYANVNGIRIYYETYGEGPPVILIGGLGSEIQSWATQIPIYSKHFMVIAFDNRGAGKSDKPDVPYTTELMADDTRELLRALGVRSSYVAGKSMGGMIGQWLAIKHPDIVKKLVLGCTSASRDEVGNEILRMGRETATKIGMKAVWLTAIFWGYTREYIEKNLSSIKETLAKIPENPEALTGYIRQSIACEGHNTKDLVGKIKCPTLVMSGEQDLSVSTKRSRELAELIPSAKLKMLKGVGHGFWRERQEEVDRLVLDFLLRGS